jgi:hypothetical protein
MEGDRNNMAGQYDKLFIRGPKPGGTTDYDKRITAIVDDSLLKDSFFFSAMFMAPQYSTGIKEAHLHPYDEILFFHGLDPDNPTELGWEMDLFLGDEFIRHTITKTSIIYLPKQFIHGPLVTRMKKPVFHLFTVFGPTGALEDFTGTIKQEGAFEKRYDNYIVSGPKPGQMDTDYKYTTYLDDSIIKGSPYFSSTFISTANPFKEETPHSYPYKKILGFFGNNFKDRFDLGAEVEFRIGEKLEKHTFNQSTIVFIPAGLSHCIEKVKINRPFIFVECADNAGLT